MSVLQYTCNLDVDWSIQIYLVSFVLFYVILIANRYTHLKLNHDYSTSNKNKIKRNLLVHLLNLVHITLLNSMNFKAKMTKNKSILQTRDVIIRRFSIKILNIDHSYFKYKNNA